MWPMPTYLVVLQELQQTDWVGQLLIDAPFPFIVEFPEEEEESGQVAGPAPSVQAVWPRRWPHLFGPFGSACPTQPVPIPTPIVPWLTPAYTLPPIPIAQADSCICSHNAHHSRHSLKHT